MEEATWGKEKESVRVLGELARSPPGGLITLCHTEESIKTSGFNTAKCPFTFVPFKGFCFCAEVNRGKPLFKPNRIMAAVPRVASRETTLPYMPAWYPDLKAHRKSLCAESEGFLVRDVRRTRPASSSTVSEDVRRRRRRQSYAPALRSCVFYQWEHLAPQCGGGGGEAIYK